MARHTPERIAAIRGHLSELDRRGVRVADFAEEIGVTPWTVYSWKRRFAAAAEADAPRSGATPTLSAPTWSNSTVRSPQHRSRSTSAMSWSAYIPARTPTRCGRCCRRCGHAEPAAIGQDLPGSRSHRHAQADRLAGRARRARAGCGSDERPPVRVLQRLHDKKTERYAVDDEPPLFDGLDHPEPPTPGSRIAELTPRGWWAARQS